MQFRRFSLKFHQPIYFSLNLFYDFFVGNFSIQAEHNKYIAAILFFERLEAGFHSLRQRITTEIRTRCYRFNLYAYRFIPDFCDIIDIPSMIQLRVAFFKNYIGKYFG